MRRMMSGLPLQVCPIEEAKAADVQELCHITGFDLHLQFMPFGGGWVRSCTITKCTHANNIKERESVPLEVRWMGINIHKARHGEDMMRLIDLVAEEDELELQDAEDDDFYDADLVDGLPEWLFPTS